VIRSALLFSALLAAAPAGAATLVSQFAVPNGTDLSGLAGTGQNRLGGFGSDLLYDAATDSFLGMTDRGPGGGVLSYAPRLQGFRLDIDRGTGAINGFTLSGTTLFRQADGSTYNGLNPQLLNASSATLGGSLDPEGLARLANGNLLVSDEYGPSVIEFTPGGQFVRQFETPTNLLPRAGTTLNYVDGRPTITSGRQDNRGFEGLTVSPDGRTAYAVLQDPLVNEGRAGNGNADGRFSRNVRIVAFDTATGRSTGQYIYQLESIADINGRVPGTADDFSASNQGRSIGVSAIQAVGDGTLLVLERDNRGLGVDPEAAALPVGSKRIYRIDLAGATDVAGVSLAGTNDLPAGTRPVSKTATPFIDLAAALRGMGLTIPEKIEGMAFGPRLANGDYTLIVVTDNDFSVTQNGQGTQFDVCTDGAGTFSQVGLGAGCTAGQSLIPNLIYSFRVSQAEYAQLTGLAAVPEPATWGLMLTGFALVGGAIRRRRAGVRFA